jgi:hypothetical protein
MTATTYTYSRGSRPGASLTSRLARFFAKMIAAQEVRARKRVQAHLRWQDDELLENIGYSAADIRRLRGGEFVPVPGAWKTKNKLLD